MFQMPFVTSSPRDPGKRRPCGGYCAYLLKKDIRKDNEQAMQEEPEGWGITLNRSAGRLGCRRKKTTNVLDGGDVMASLCGCTPHGRGWRGR